MIFKTIKKRLIKLFITFMVCLALFSGPVGSNEVRKMLEHLTGARAATMKELDAEGKEVGEPKESEFNK
jgi:hypothetical protein